MTGSRSGSRVAAALVVLALAGASSTAHAEPTAAERETARQLMEQARDRVDKKDLKGALDAFKAADEIMHVPTTGFQVANTQVELGQLVEARETLSRVMRIPKAPSDPPPFEKARTAAATLYDELGARIPSLRFAVNGAGADVSVAVDDVPVAASVLKFPFKVNPGHHVVVAKSGTASAKQEVDIAERETKDVVLTLSGGAPVETKVAPPPEQKASRGTSPLTYIGFGVAGVGVIVGSVTGVMMFSKKSDLEAGCSADKLCPPSTHDDYSSAYTMATISTVSFIVAGVGAGVGIYGLLSSKSSRPTTGSVSVEPWASVSGGGLRGTF